MPTDLTQILQLLGPGPVAVILACAIWFLPKYLASEKQKALDQQAENQLKRLQLRVWAALGKFLKEQGHEIDMPEIPPEI